MKTAISLSLVLTLVVFNFIFNVNGNETANHKVDFVINIPEAIEDTKTSKELQFFYNAVYDELNIEPTYLFIPAKRGFKYFKNNTIQAEAFRTEAVGDLNVLATQIKPAIAKVAVALFCIKPKYCTINKGFVYGMPSGFEKGKIICARLGINCEYINQTAKLSKMLDLNIVDAVLSPYPAYKKLLCSTEQNDFYFNRLKDSSFGIYHYINTEDRTFIQNLEQSLKKHLAKGTLNLQQFTGVPNLEKCNKTLHSILTKVTSP
ncbi:hypothetical protein [Algibacillus agarilyticus]|uniref:hypothetical protein n=1 Tax=Algibacillus agarilyticus TaxID=2234133 RepID=UPI000DD0ACCA|nr:hypothetical protein [Algibacillus agarilyticus]